MLKAGQENHQRSPITQGQLFLLILIVSAAFSISSRVGIPTFLQPSLVGGLWGLMYVVGTLLCSHLGRPSLFGFAVLGASYLNLTSLHRVTDFDWSACLLIVATVTGAGWLVQRWVSSRTAPDTSGRQSASQWGLWDIVVLTTIAALFCRAIPNLQESPLFAAAVCLTLIVGLSGCWIAHQWAIRDRFAWIEIGMSCAVVLLACFLLIRFAPGRGFETLQWLVVGPFSVLAAQGVTVLACLALTRTYNFGDDASLQSRTLPSI